MDNGQIDRMILKLLETVASEPQSGAAMEEKMRRIDFLKAQKD